MRPICSENDVHIFNEIQKMPPQEGQGSPKETKGNQEEAKGRPRGQEGEAKVMPRLVVLLQQNEDFFRKCSFCRGEMGVENISFC